MSSSNQNIAFVRPEGEMLTQQAPPQSAQGLVGWMKTNLFATWSDRVTTVIIVGCILWLAVSTIDSWFISANWRGKTQAEGQTAEFISGVDHKFDDAQAVLDNWQRQAETLVRDENRNLANLAKDIRTTDWQAQPVVSNFRGTTRTIPSNIDSQISIAQSKLPLSAYARLAIVRRQLADPAVETAQAVVGLDGLVLLPDEEATLRAQSAPWTVPDQATSAAFATAASAIERALAQTQASDNGSDNGGGKVFVPLADLLAEVSAIVAQADGQRLLTKPTRIALQFSGLVDGIVGTPMTTIPVSRIQKLRKDTLSNIQIDQLRQRRALESVEPLAEDASRLQQNAHRTKLENAAAMVSDGQLFLKREMPGGHPEAIENLGLLGALDAMNFWDIAQVLAEPEGVAPQSNLASLKAPLVWQTLVDNHPNVRPGPDDYAGATFALVDGYLSQDLDAMRAAWAHFAPLQAWASSHDGSNWAVIVKNWDTLLWGGYPDQALWRVGVVAALFILALLPVLVPACRNVFFISFTAVYPLIVLFLLGGLSVRLYGFDVPQDAGVFQAIYSDLGKVIQAGVALVLGIVFFALRRGPLGKTAGPALVTAMVLSSLYFVIMIWGTVINPKAAQSGILIDNNFTGLLTADHPLGQEVSLDKLQAQMDALLEEANSGTLSPEQAQAKRAQMQELRKGRTAAQKAERDFANVVKKGEGTFVVLPFVKSGEWGGLLVTMVLGVFAMAASLPIGIILAFGRQSTLPIVRWFSTGLIEITRGVPLIALLLIVTFVLPKLLPAGVEYPKLGLVFVAICLFGGVYQAEVVRGGLQSLPKGQYEAAQALGLNFWQMSRLIALPQALKAVIPAIVNTFIGLFKDTTLVIVVGIFDFLTVAETQITAKNAWNVTKPETLLVIALVFFVLMFSLSRYSIWLEKRLATDHG